MLAPLHSPPGVWHPPPYPPSAYPPPYQEHVAYNGWPGAKDPQVQSHDLLTLRSTWHVLRLFFEACHFETCRRVCILQAGRDPQSRNHSLDLASTFIEYLGEQQTGVSALHCLTDAEAGLHLHEKQATECSSPLVCRQVSGFSLAQVCLPTMLAWVLALLLRRAGLVLWARSVLSSLEILDPSILLETSSQVQAKPHAVDQAGGGAHKASLLVSQLAPAMYDMPPDNTFLSRVDKMSETLEFLDARAETGLRRQAFSSWQVAPEAGELPPLPAEAHVHAAADGTPSPPPPPVQLPPHEQLHDAEPGDMTAAAIPIGVPSSQCYRHSLLL